MVLDQIVLGCMPAFHGRSNRSAAALIQVKSAVGISLLACSPAQWGCFPGAAVAWPGPGWPSSSAASAQNWRSSLFLGSFSLVQATALSKYVRALSFSPFCQRARATKNQSARDHCLPELHRLLASGERLGPMPRPVLGQGKCIEIVGLARLQGYRLPGMLQRLGRVPQPAIRTYGEDPGQKVLGGGQSPVSERVRIPARRSLPRRFPAREGKMRDRDELQDH